jgi:hypothetical protein
MNTTSNNRIWRVAAAAGAALLCALAVTTGLGMLVAAAPAASPIYVRTNGHDTNCNGTADIPYSAPVAPNCAVATIQQGITLVDIGGTLVVGAGTYAENISVSKGLTLLGVGAGSTIIDGGGSSRVVYVYPNIDVTISSVTIRNGAGYTGAGIFVAGNNVFTLTNSTVSNNTSCVGCSGGGIYLPSNVTAVISGCSFVDNAAGGNADGGAIWSQRNTLTVIGSTFTGNHSSGRGGAIHSALSGSALTVIESVFSNNTVTGTVNASGGAIWHDTGTLVISNTTIVNNSTSNVGGGIATSGGTAHIYGSTIAGNSAINTTVSCYGGGIRNYLTTLLIEDSVVRDNWVSGDDSLGGGIFSDGPTTLDRVTVSGNSSNYYSGGIHSQDPLTLTNVTISGNSAADAAGGLTQTDVGKVATIVNCTIASNTLTSGSPSWGGGILVYSTLNMTNTLLAYNDNGNCSIGSGGSLNSGGHNVEDGDTCGLGATGDITGTDPYLGPLGFYGGPSVGATASEEGMRTQALLRGSPAIDMGDDAACPPVDQRGVARPVDGDKDTTAICDIGAFEFDLLDDVFLPLTLRNY